MSTLLLWFLSKLFRLEEINGHGRCPTYLYRWLVFRCRWFQVYLHRFVGDDWSRDMHDHPKRFVSVGLAGGYVEHTPAGSHAFRAPWIRTFPADHVHRLTLGKHRECWTLVIVLRASREWGFWHGNEWINWRPYVKSKGKEADQATVCN